MLANLWVFRALAYTLIFVSIKEVICSNAIWADVRPSVQVDWKQNLGPNYEGAFFRWAICPDGSSYFTDALGRLARLNANGKVLEDRTGVPELRGTVAVSCDVDSKLRAANWGRLLVLDPTQTPVVQLSVDINHLRLRPSRLAVTREGEWVILGQRNGREFVYVLDRTGALVRSFAEAPVLLPSSLASTSARRGSLLLNDARNEVLYLPMSPPEMRVYDRDGQLVRRSSYLLPDAIIPTQNPISGDISPADEVMYATNLPNDRVVVQMFRVVNRSTPSRVRKSSLIILNQGLNPEVMFDANAVGITGFLQGSSADGALFFATITPQQGIQLARIKLELP